MMKQPPLIIPSQVDVTPAELHTLPNGVRLYTLAAPEFEVLRISFVFRAGTARQREFFTASTTANMLAEGSRGMTAQQIAERLDYYGSWYDANIDRDYAYISFAALSKFVPQTLEVAREILLRPLFPEEELRSYCAKRRQRLTIDRTKVDVRAREAFAQALFGTTHPYGIAAPTEAYDAVTRQAVERFYREHYTADQTLVVCSGRIGAQELDAVGRLAGALATSAAGAEEPMPAPETTHRLILPHAGAVQSAIRIGRLLFPRQHPDFLGMQVVAMLLGGYFGSRLMQNLRERNGFTYGVVAAMVNFEQAGYFAVATQVGSEVTAEALGQIYAEIERLRNEPVSEEELSLVRNMMVGEMLRILDGPFGIADVTIENLLCGDGNEVIEQNFRRIRAITPAEVQRLARQYLAHEDLVTVVVGDPELGTLPE